MSQTSEVDIESKIERLRQPQTYPEQVETVEAKETHMSWVFLTPQTVYKMKKPVRYPYLDFSTLEKRKADCAREVKLNRRLAPGVYEGTVPLTLESSGQLELDGKGPPVEWLVKMRRLPKEKMLDYMLEHGAVNPRSLSRIGKIFSRFYREQDSEGLSPDEYLKRLRNNIMTNLEELKEPSHELDCRKIERLHEAQLALLDKNPELFTERARSGRIIEGHGDLRPEHICLTDPPVVFDCLEFNRDLRILDPVEELAYLAVECELLKRPEAGELILTAYTEDSGDRPPRRLIRFHKVYRAALRARLCVMHRKDLHHDHWPKWKQKGLDYLRLAERHLDQSA